SSASRPRTSCLIGKTLADDALQQPVGALGVFDTKSRPVVIAELVFGQIAVQMLFVTVLIDALHAALEDAEISLNGVAVDAAILKVHIFAASMIGGAMRREMVLHIVIAAVFVGHYARF